MTPNRSTRALVWLTLLAFANSTVFGATVDLANVPLVSMSTKVVRPNVLFILDDSGSMNSNFMPDDVDNNNGSNCFYNFGYNKIAYNPSSTYDPPKNYDGTSFANASPTAAYDNGFASAGGPRNLTGQTAVPSTTWSAFIALGTDPLAMTAGSNVVTVTTVAAHGLSSGTDVTFTGLSPTTGRINNISINGRTFPVTVTSPTTFQITSLFRTATNTGNYGGTGGSWSFATVTYTNEPNYYYYSYTASPTSPSSTCQADASYTRVGIDTASAAQQQNYANWHSFYRTRMLMMKSATGRAFVGVDDKFRVGFTTISETGTGASRWLGMAKFDATQKSNWYTKLYGISSGGYTPLRGALSKAGRYYAGTLVPGNDDPMQYSCQKNFSILTTDGYWNKRDESATYGPKREDNVTDVGDMDSDITTSPRPMYEAGAYSNTLADIARYYWRTDLRTTSTPGGLGDDSPATTRPVSANIKNSAGVDLPDGHQHMNTITLGLGMSGNLSYPGDLVGLTNGTVDWPDPQTGVSGDSGSIVTRLDDLWHAAVNGGGVYLSASDAEDVVDSLRQALANITDADRSGAAAATSSLEPVAGDNFAYVAQYTTSRWHGDIEARLIDLTTGALSSTVQWSAQSLLDATTTANSDTRNIYTWNGTTRVSFALANLNAADFNPALLTQYGSWNATQRTNATSDALVSFLRGQHEFEARNDATHTDLNKRLFRERAHVLGDIVDSSPVYVKKPPFRYADAGYAAFVGAQLTRAGTVYVGANDGMLHAFDSVTGAERWAYVPRMLHSQLYRLANADYSANHRYYVNGNITVGDAYDGSSWRTVLIAGLGAGGKGFVALDITDPANPSVLWEYTNANMGYAFGNPVLTKRSSDGKWVALLTSGYNNTDGQGHLFVVDAFSGATLSNVVTGAGTDPNLSGLGKINNWVLDTMVNNSTQYVYGGDLAGNLWRFDISSSPAAVQLLGTTSATPGARPITSKPELARIRDATGTYHRIVYVGTGRYLGGNDVAGSSTPELTQQMMLAVKDTGTSVGVMDSTGGLVAQTLNTAVTPRTIPSPQPVNWASDKGWYVTIPLGERATIDPRLQLGTISFVANKPVDDWCAMGGESWLYTLDYKSGSAISTQASREVGYQVDPKTIGTGLTIIRLPNGQVIAIVNTPDGTKTQRVDIDPTGGGTVRRVGYREIN